MKETNECIYCQGTLDEYTDEFCDDCFADMMEFDK